jgi:hypothetical protein
LHEELDELTLDIDHKNRIIDNLYEKISRLKKETTILRKEKSFSAITIKELNKKLDPKSSSALGKRRYCPEDNPSSGKRSKLGDEYACNNRDNGDIGYMSEGEVTKYFRKDTDQYINNANRDHNKEDKNMGKQRCVIM